MRQREFLVVYDYGMGGVWGLATAAHETELTSAFPELTIIRDWPQWIDDERRAEMKRNSSFVVGQEGTYPEWLRVLISERQSKSG